MAQRPNIRPFDFSTAYANLGKAVGDIPAQATQGFMRGKELEFAGKREDRAVTKEGREAKAFALDEKMVLEKLDGIQNQKDRRKAVQKLAIDTIIENNPKIPANQLAELDNTIKTLDFESVTSFMREYAQNRGNYQTHKSKYGKTVKTFEPSAKDFLMGGTADKFQQMRDAGVKSYMNKGLASKAQEYIQANKGGNPNDKGFMQSLLQDQQGTEIATDENYRKLVKDTFLGQLDKYKTQTSRMQAKTAGKRANLAGQGKGLVDKINSERFNYRTKFFDKTRKVVNDLSKVNLKNLGDMAQFIHGEEFSKMSEENQKKLGSAIAEMATHEQVDNILLQAADQGLEKFTTATAAQNAINDILDGDGETQTENQPFEEMVLGIQAKLAGPPLAGEDAPAAVAPAAAATPAAAKAETPTFKTAKEALSAGLPKGTIVMIEGIGEVEID